MYHPVSFWGDYRTQCPISELTIFCPLRTIGPTLTPGCGASLNADQTTP
jgi:hypothetical protein